MRLLRSFLWVVLILTGSIWGLWDDYRWTCEMWSRRRSHRRSA